MTPGDHSSLASMTWILIIPSINAGHTLLAECGSLSMDTSLVVNEYIYHLSNACCVKQ